jgi:hypothetical protein
MEPKMSEAEFVYDGDVAAADRAAVWSILDPAAFRSVDDWSTTSRKLHDLLERGPGRDGRCPRRCEMKTAAWRLALSVPHRAWQRIRAVRRRQWMDWGLNLALIVLIARGGFLVGIEYEKQAQKNVTVAERSAPVVNFSWK